MPIKPNTTIKIPINPPGTHNLGDRVTQFSPFLNERKDIITGSLAWQQFLVPGGQKKMMYGQAL